MVLQLDFVTQMIFGHSVLENAMTTVLVALLAMIVGPEFWLVLKLNAHNLIQH